MLRYILIALLALFSNQVNAQQFEKPDYKSIEQTIKDKNSVWYYPTLIARYRQNDTTLTLRDYRMLYFGEFFQDDYPGGYSSEENDSIKSYRQQPLTVENIYRIIKTAEKCLDASPFDLNVINTVITYYYKAGDTATAIKYKYKLRKLIGVILSSGDGLTEETAMHVLTVQDEYIILEVYGLQSFSQTLTAKTCDYLEVNSNKENIKGLYFDVNMIFKYGYGKMFGTDEKKKSKK